MAKRKMNQLREKNKRDRNVYRICWDYIRESRNFICSTVLIFAVLLFIGFAFPAPDFIAQRINEFIKNLVSQTEGLNFIQTFFFILLNNVKTSFFGLFSGVFFGIIPLIVLISNGYILGFVSKMVSNEQGAAVLLRLLPHGIFELPALFLSIALGIKLGMFVFYKDKKDRFLYDLRNALLVFLLVVVPLLIVAGIIETGLIFWLK